MIELSEPETPTIMPATRAIDIPELSHDEAVHLARTELDRFLNLLDQLREEDWSRPTSCARWAVRDVVAHLLGFADAYSSLKEFLHQADPRLLKRYRRTGMSQLDAMNQLAVDERAGLAPLQLTAGLKKKGPAALTTRARLPALIRRLPLPLGLVTPELGRPWIRIDYLTDTIFTRDMWMHRLDICRASGREMALTAEHDGRITELVVRDLAEKVRSEQSIGFTYQLLGPPGGTFLFGDESDVTITLDALDFHLLASGRLAAGEALSQAQVQGASKMAEHVLAATAVAY